MNNQCDGSGQNVVIWALGVKNAPSETLCICARCGHTVAIADDSIVGDH